MSLQDDEVKMMLNRLDVASTASSAVEDRKLRELCGAAADMIRKLEQQFGGGK